jgi:hypothetical protein
VINCGCASIKASQKPIGDGRLLTDCERLLIVGEQRSISECVRVLSVSASVSLPGLRLS